MSGFGHKLPSCICERRAGRDQSKGIFPRLVCLMKGSQMKIAIVGTGNVGSALAQGLKKSSHRVVLGARKITDSATQDLAADAGAELTSPEILIASPSAS